MENYPAVNIFCELWPFGTYDPDTRTTFLTVQRLPISHGRKGNQIVKIAKNVYD